MLVGLYTTRYQTITEAVNAIYLLADRPDLTCGDLIKALSEDVCLTGMASWSVAGLSKLLYVVGQVALQHNLHLDSIERHWKRKMAKNSVRSSIADDGLGQVTASAEDDIGEVIAELKENELLFGPGSILKIFGPMAAYVCQNSKLFTVLHIT